MKRWQTYIANPLLWALIGVGAQSGISVAQPAPTAEQAVPEVEESDVAILPAASPHWLIVHSSFDLLSRLVDADSGKQLGGLHVASLSSVAFGPGGRHIYVAESIWTKGNRGTRQDMLTVYDGKTLKLMHEIPLPGRLLSGHRVQLLSISVDGRFAYVYDMSPASSVIIVDLDRRKVLTPVEIPGCGLTFAVGNDRVASLCGDGTISLLTMGKGKPVVKQTEPFFSPDEDPIFDNSVLDPKSGKGYFLTYTGLVYEVAVGESVSVAKPWSLQEAAGMDRATPKPLALNWLPGGRQLMAYHPGTERLYVLMHQGEFWTQKENGTELWEVDVKAHKVLRRHKLEDPIRSIAVSQDAKPKLYLNGEGKLYVFDAATMTGTMVMEDVNKGLFAVTP